MKSSYRTARPKNRRIHLVIEELETRLTPAVHGALNGAILTVTADAANDQAAVQVSGSNLLVVDATANVTVFSTAVANVQGIAATGSGLAGQSVSLGGTLTLPGGVSASGWARLQQTGSYDVSLGGYSATVSETIVLTPGAGISVTDGDISLTANTQSSHSSGDFVGVDVDGATITTSGAGDISLQGQGGDDTTTAGHLGVYIHGGAAVSSTSPIPRPRHEIQPGSFTYPPNGGVITIAGTGGQGSGQDFGVLVEDARTLVTSALVFIDISGIGGQSSESGETGIVVRNGAVLGNVSLNGTGGAGASDDDGIEMSNATVTGSMTGHGGSGNGGANIGIHLTTGAQFFGDELMGTGGSGSGNGNVGILLNNAAQFHDDSNLLRLIGTGGGAAGSDLNDGVSLEGNISVTSKGFGVSISGAAGAGTNSVGFRADQSSALTGRILDIAADTMIFAANLSATTTVTFSPITPGRGVSLGGASSAGFLGISDAELRLVTADTLEVHTDLHNGGLLWSPPVPADIVIASPIDASLSGFQTLSLNAGGAIRTRSGASSTTADVIAENLSLTAYDGISLTVDVTDLSASNQSQGDIRIDDTTSLTVAGQGSGLPVWGVTNWAPNGTIELHSAGSINVDSPIINYDRKGGYPLGLGFVLGDDVGPNGTVSLVIDGTQNQWENALFISSLGSIRAGHVRLNINGQIQGTPGQVVEIEAQDLAITSGGPVGSASSPLVTQLGVLAASATGGIYLSNNGPLTVGPVGDLGGILLPAGDIVLSTIGPGDNTFNVDGLVQTGSGNVTLMSHRVAVAGSVGDITVYPGATVRTLWGSVVLVAANGVSLVPGSAVIAVGGPMSLVGGGEFASGGSVVVDGYVGAGQNLLVTGGTGDDTFALDPTSGSSSVISAVGTGNDSYVISPSTGTSFYLFGGANAIVVGASAHQPARHLSQTGSGLSGSITFADFEQIVLNSLGQVMFF
jgi:hypothetical protein